MTPGDVKRLQAVLHDYFPWAVFSPKDSRHLHKTVLVWTAPDPLEKTVEPVLKNHDLWGNGMIEQLCGPESRHPHGPETLADSMSLGVER